MKFLPLIVIFGFLIFGVVIPAFTKGRRSNKERKLNNRHDQ